jgi:hypothetical protein
MTIAIDHDQNFKELISTFFIEFLDLFLPAIASTIDPESITFLQQEYFVDLVEGEENVIDLLAEVKQAGQETTFLVHIEAVRRESRAYSANALGLRLRSLLGLLAPSSPVTGS